VSEIHEAINKAMAGTHWELGKDGERLPVMEVAGDLIRDLEARGFTITAPDRMSAPHVDRFLKTLITDLMERVTVLEHKVCGKARI
jgi:hypothetical protein